MLSIAEQIQELEEELKHLFLTPGERADMSRELEALRKRMIPAETGGKNCPS